MNLNGVIFTSLFILGFIYIIFAFIAYSHLKEKSKSDEMAALSPWWPLYKDLYDDYGKKICKYGLVLLVIDIGLFLIWLIINNL